MLETMKLVSSAVIVPLQTIKLAVEVRRNADVIHH